jgi:hypothetical protein
MTGRLGGAVEDDATVDGTCFLDFFESCGGANSFAKRFFCAAEK